MQDDRGENGVMAMPKTLDHDVRRATEGTSNRTQRLCAAVAALVVLAAVPTFFVDGILNGTPVMNGSARGTALVMFALALLSSLLGWAPRSGARPGSGLP